MNKKNIIIFSLLAIASVSLNGWPNPPEEKGGIGWCIKYNEQSEDDLQRRKEERAGEKTDLELLRKTANDRVERVRTWNHSHSNTLLPENPTLEKDALKLLECSTWEEFIKQWKPIQNTLSKEWYLLNPGFIKRNGGIDFPNF